jgi:TolB-like protein/Tfp pilus assembly protein PilF
MQDAAVVRFLKELRRRRVFRVAGLYVVGVWLLMQAADILFPAWNIPEVAIRYLLWAGLLGFPVALVFGWVFDISAQGIRRTRPATGEAELRQALPLGLSDYLILSAFLVIVGLIFVDTAGRVMQTATHEPLRPSLAEIEPNSVAVLPFENLSSDPEQAYFADGISEEILNRLSAFRELKVIARTSSFAFKDSGYDIARISGLLAVNYLLQGSVRRDGQQLRIAAQLVDKTGMQVWSSSFDREMGAIFVLQDEIAEAVAKSIAPQIAAPEAGRRPPVADAYDLFLSAREIVYRRDFLQFDQALEYLNQAISIDPGFAEAYVERAVLLTLDLGASTDQAATLEQASKDVDQAMALKPGLARAHAARAFVLSDDAFHAGEGERLLHNALALDPNLVDARVWLSNLLLLQGRFEEADAQLELASRIDPLSPRVNLNLSLFEFERGNAAAGETRLLRLLELPHSQAEPWRWLWHLYIATGRLGDAVELAARWQHQAPDPGVAAAASSALAFSFAGLEMWEVAELWQAEAERMSSSLIVLLARADLLNAQGRYEEALTELREALSAHGADQGQVPSAAVDAYSLSLGMTGATEEAIELLELRHWVKTALQEPLMAVPPGWVIRLAWLYQQTNSTERANTLLTNTRHGYQLKLAAGRLHLSDELFWFAVHALLSGDHDAAVDRLQQAFDAGWRRYYPLSSDPLWDPLRNDPRFQAILAAARSDVAAQRSQVERDVKLPASATADSR